MMDTLNQIDGYGQADNLISGYYGLSFMLEGKGGVQVLLMILQEN